MLASGMVGPVAEAGGADAAVNAPAEDESQKLLEGDDIKITFPGAANLDTIQKIRTDGKISLPLIGEVQAAGLTPLELQQQLAQRYATELISNEVNVAIVASTYPVYVIGAVLRPGEVRCDRPTTLSEAIAKAGGIDYIRARTDKVKVIRRGEKARIINLKAVYDGKEEDTFFVKPSDQIIVPEKTWQI